jgi:hypothetical protein
VAALLGDQDGPTRIPHWLVRAGHWLLTKTPRDFGYFRSRWSCEALAEVLAWQGGPRLSRETIRRGLRRLEFVWRRPRPVVGPSDPRHDQQLAAIRRLLAELPEDETAVFQDEVDVNLNPKIGPCWMVRGEQAEVVTPGDNVKRHLAGSLHWRTGALLVSAPGARRDTRLFLAHLDDLRQRLRGYRKDPRHLRRRGLPRLAGGPGVPLPLAGPHRTALPAQTRPRGQPDRARLVAAARGGHPKPPLPDHRRVARRGLPVVRHRAQLLHPGTGPLRPGRLTALRFWGGVI